MKKERVAIVGCGINGAVAGALLAEAGYKTTIFERRHILGGACCTENVFDDKTYTSRGAYVLSLYPQELIQRFKINTSDLLIPRLPVSSINPFPDGRRAFLMGTGVNTLEEIARFSRRDAEIFPQYEDFLEKIARIVRPLFLDGSLDLPNLNNMGDLTKAFYTFRKTKRLDREEREHAHRLLVGSATGFLEQWFESDVLITALATDGVIGSTQSPDELGTAYVLLHHYFGNLFNQTGVWGYVRGGMGALVKHIIEYGKSHGLQVKKESPVKMIVVENSTVRGVVLEDDSFFEVDIVISNAHPITTFRNLISEEHLSDALKTKLRTWKTESASAKVNLLLDRLPQFKGVDSRMLTGTIHIPPNLADIRQAHEDYTNGMWSNRPMLEMTIPSLLDTSLAPDGRYVVNVFVQWIKYGRNISQGTKFGNLLLKDIIETIEPYIDGDFKSSIVNHDLLTPFDLEQVFGLIGGNIFHGEMTLDQLGLGRFRYFYPELRNFWLAGSGTELGGGVHGCSGLYVAKQIIGKRFRL